MSSVESSRALAALRVQVGADRAKPGEGRDDEEQAQEATRARAHGEDG